MRIFTQKNRLNIIFNYPIMWKTSAHDWVFKVIWTSFHMIGLIKWICFQWRFSSLNKSSSQWVFIEWPKGQNTDLIWNAKLCGIRYELTFPPKFRNCFLFFSFIYLLLFFLWIENCIILWSFYNCLLFHVFIEHLFLFNTF